MAVEMDMNYPAGAVDEILRHRYEGLDEATFGRYHGDAAGVRPPLKKPSRAARNRTLAPQGTAVDAMLVHRYGGS
jgi:hypothetical protein